MGCPNFTGYFLLHLPTSHWRLSTPSSYCTMTSTLKLPEDLKGKLNSKFWTTSAIKRIPSSTFGTSPKVREKVKIDDGYEVTRTSKEWVAIDKHNCSHGRVRVEAMLGKLEETPAPGHYSPKIDMQSKRETIAPMITLSAKPADHYLDELEDLKATRVQIQLMNIPLILEKKKKKKVKPYRISRGQFEDLNIDDMRNSLLPGPGTYKCNYEAAEKFERPPSAKLKPKRNAAIPRKVILPETLDILDSPAQKQPAVHYDLDFDPRKSNRSFTIGEVLPAPKKVTVPVGPGYYNLDKVLATGEENVLSSTTNLHKKPIGSFDSYRRAMSKSSFARSKSSFNT